MSWRVTNLLYVIFDVFNLEDEALAFFNYINSKHDNIKFTMEKEIDNKLSFMGVVRDNSSTSLKTCVELYNLTMLILKHSLPRYLSS